MEQMETDDEILELAISREIEAHDLFLELAERVREPQIQSLLRELAQEELEHKHKLELEIIKSGRVVRETDETAVPSRGHILSNTNESLDMDYKDVLMLAIEKEDASFRMYVGLVSNVRDEKSREVLLALAEEEVKHKLRFQAEYELLLENG